MGPFPMIFGIGVDVCRIVRVQRVYEKYGNRFLRRMLHPVEIDTFMKRPSMDYLASRYVL